MVVAAYTRVSKAEDGHDTIKNQRPQIQSLCQAGGYRIYDWYDDDDVNGTVPLEDRPQGKRLLADARLGAFQVVIVWRVDRFGRDTRHMLNAHHELQRVGLTFRSATEPFDTTTSAGMLMFEMLASFASFERRTILDRSRAGCQRNAEEGAYHGGIPAYGYMVVGERRDARLVPNEEPINGLGFSEAYIVRWIYHHVAVERGTTYSAATYLNGLHVPTRYARGGFQRRKEGMLEPSGRWTAGAVYNIVVKPLYKGEWPYKTIMRHVPPLVDTETWQRAQDRFSANVRYSRRNGKRDYLLRSFIRCAHCEHNYVGSNTKVHGTAYPKYICQYKDREGCRCRGAGIPAEKVEALVWDRLCKRVQDDEQLRREIAALLDSKIQDHRVLEVEVGAIRRELEGKAAERTRVFSVFRRGRMTDTELDQQLDDLNREELALNRRLQTIERDLRAAQEREQRLAELHELIERSRRRLTEADTTEERRVVLEMMVETIWATTERISPKRAKVNLKVEWTLGDGCQIGSGSGGRLDSYPRFLDVLNLAA